MKYIPPVLIVSNYRLIGRIQTVFLGYYNNIGKAAGKKKAFTATVLGPNRVDSTTSRMN
jgi:hypothetical protein